MIHDSHSENKFDTLLNHEQHSLVFFGTKIRVDEGVFSPDSLISHSTGMIYKYLGDVEGQVVADVGTGTGTLAILAVKRGAAKVVATDPDELAIANAKFNVISCRLEPYIEVIETSLLKGVDDTFDVIIANLPIAKELWGKEPLLIVEQFISNLTQNIKADSRVLLTWASFGENKEKLEEVFLKKGFRFEIKTETRLGYDWYLYILTLDQAGD